MDDTAKLLLECIAAVSVICCVVYLLLLARKSMDERANPFRGAMLSKKIVTVRYEDKENPMWIYFYTDGIVFERSGGKKLYVPSANIIRVERIKENEKLRYKFVFNPETSEEDILELLSEEELIHDFLKIVPEDKLADTEQQ